MTTLMDNVLNAGEPGSKPLDLPALLSSLAGFLPQSDKIDEISATLAQRPAQNTLVILGLSAAVFFAAERDVNPKVTTIYDALEYCSSSLSVGYTSIFPQTPLGKLVATFLMTYGPALTGAMLDGPKTTAAENPEMNRKILSTLESILAELRK
jgi:hypothetical protein